MDLAFAWWVHEVRRMSLNWMRLLSRAALAVAIVALQTAPPVIVHAHPMHGSHDPHSWSGHTHGGRGHDHDHHFHGDRAAPSSEPVWHRHITLLGLSWTLPTSAPTGGSDAPKRQDDSLPGIAGRLGEPAPRIDPPGSAAAFFAKLDVEPAWLIQCPSESAWRPCVIPPGRVTLCDTARHERSGTQRF
jgi:hypothetical protein